MAGSEKVTVDRSYFEALLRRADFHTSSQSIGRPDLANNISVSRVEYDTLLRTSRDHQILKDALFQGGVTEQTLDILISGTNDMDQRKDSGIWGKGTNPCNEGFTTNMTSELRSTLQPNVLAQQREMPWKDDFVGPTFNLAPGTAPYASDNLQSRQKHLRIPDFQRKASYGISSVADDVAFDDDEGSIEEPQYVNQDLNGAPGSNQKRTLFFSGFSERTSYRDLLSVIKGGKLLSVNLRPEKTATVTFLDAAADFLGWAKKNDIYLNSKRIEVKWADRQFHLNAHIANKIASGATRNIVIHSAVEKGLTEAQIRDDMDHIHNLVIVDVKFRKGGAHLSMNSIHNALFARTCMLSRKTYKGCKIEFVRDECDVPLPSRSFVPKVAARQPTKKKAGLANRFDMLNIDGTEGSSDENNRKPSDDDSEHSDSTANVGVNLDFLD